MKYQCETKTIEGKTWQLVGRWSIRSHAEAAAFAVRNAGAYARVIPQAGAYSVWGRPGSPGGYTGRVHNRRQYQ